MKPEIVNMDGVPLDWCMAEIEDAEQTKQRKCRKAEFILQDDGVSVLERFFWEPVNFERLRRITGYLVGDVTRFNDAKRAEERDRVKHI